MLDIHSQTISEIAKALAKAQGEFDTAKKSATNPHFRSKYADLTAVWDALRDILPKFGLSVIQSLMPQDDGKTLLITTLLHSSGEWFKSYAPLMIDKANSQGMGSAISYMRRYSLAAICGIVQDDDDGNAASKPIVPEKRVCVTEQQAKILFDNVALCDEKFKVYFNNFLSENNLGCITDMSIETYNQILSTTNRILKKKLNEENGNENK